MPAVLSNAEALTRAALDFVKDRQQSEQDRRQRLEEIAEARDTLTLVMAELDREAQALRLQLGDPAANGTGSDVRRFRRPQLPVESERVRTIVALATGLIVGLVALGVYAGIALDHALKDVSWADNGWLQFGIFTLFGYAGFELTRDISKRKPEQTE